MGNTISREQYQNEKSILLIEIRDLKQIIREKDLLIDNLRLFKPINPKEEYIGD